MVTDTIVAQCTPSGPGALALIRISGPDAAFIATQCAKLSSKKALKNVPTHTIHHGWVVDKDGTHLDEVMFFVMHGPRTFTGTNVVEITTHNNPFIIESVIKQIIECGARLAQKGEFSRQAVENGKIDLVQAEAINELIHANSQQLLKQSLQQLEGSFSHFIAELETDIVTLVALCEASFEFLEEDVDFSQQIKTTIAGTLKKINSLKKSFDQQQQLRQGIRIALIGSVNAGKSSLFNALIGKQRAIVTDIAGTTRDVIEAGLYKNGVYWTLIDTAGLRQADNLVEQKGIERSHHEAKTADIVLLICDGSRLMTTEEKKVYQEIVANYKEKIIPIQSKSDLPEKIKSLFSDSFKVNETNKKSIQKLEKALEERIKKQFEKDSSPFLLNKRHFTTLLSFEEQLKNIQKMTTNTIEYELLAYHLKDALESLTELTGKSVNQKVFETVFQSFCVGK
jgi:tRNA modification GTPase